MNKVHSIILGLLFFASIAEAQSFYAARRERSIILTGGLGTSTYYGELANSNAYIKAQPNINAGLEYYLSNRIGARVELNWFTLAGDDKDANGGGRTSRNLSFQSSNFELSAVGIVNLFSHGDRYYRRPNINVYGFGGIGLLYFNPKATYKGTSYALQPLKTEGVSYSLVTPVIPFGLGVRFKVSPQFNVSLEAGFRKVFTDYLDDVSTVYLDNNSFSDPIAKALADRRPELADPLPLNPAGAKRGGSSTNDSYMLLNAKIEYYLPWSFGGSDRRKSYSQKRKSSNSRYNSKGGLKRKR
jgi:hypothetical protein